MRSVIDGTKRIEGSFTKHSGIVEPLVLVQLGKLIHILLIKDKVEQINVLSNAARILGLKNTVKKWNEIIFQYFKSLCD